LSPVRHRSDSVVAQDHEQALDPGKPRLGVIVVGFFREIDDRPFWRFGRLKWACWLAGQPRALAISKLLLRMQKSASPFCGSGAAP
jgi:hypothetical protein